LRYLVGPGHDGEHRDPHLVAGERVELWEGVKLDAWAADEIAKQLGAPPLRWRSRVTVPRKLKDGGVAVDERGRPERADAHVWHCSLSLHPEEEALSEMAGEFIREMGFGGQRWVAVRHGLTKNGGDHIHLVVQLVTDDGKTAGVHNDRPRAQEACRQLERRHGLRVVEGRDRRRGARATKYRQRYRAEEQHKQGLTGSPEPDREVLERVVRRLAAASSGEGEFVRRLRAKGLIVRPRFGAGRDDQVVGYSVALTPAAGQDVVPHSGGKLAKDLTLPRLRGAHGWTADEPDAIDEWRRAFHGQPPGAGAESNLWVQKPSWDEALEQLRELRATARHLPPGERGAWAQTAAHGAAVLYGSAELAGEHAPALRQLGRELAVLGVPVLPAGLLGCLARRDPGPRTAPRGAVRVRRAEDRRAGVGQGARARSATRNCTPLGPRRDRDRRRGGWGRATAHRAVSRRPSPRAAPAPTPSVATQKITENLCVELAQPLAAAPCHSISSAASDTSSRGSPLHNASMISPSPAATSTAARIARISSPHARASALSRKVRSP
jgi:Relaxase/Mobilisation nuclease domain